MFDGAVFWPGGMHFHHGVCHAGTARTAEAQAFVGSCWKLGEVRVSFWLERGGARKQPDSTARSALQGWNGTAGKERVLAPVILSLRSEIFAGCAIKASGKVRLFLLAFSLSPHMLALYPTAWPVFDSSCAFFS